MNDNSISNYYHIDDTKVPKRQPPSYRYMDEFISKLHCAADLLDLHVFPNAKEITESMGIYNAAFISILQKIKDADTSSSDGIVVIGDGSTPRTGAMFAYRTKGWKVYVIDPALKVTNNETSFVAPWDIIPNLVCIQNKIENVRIKLRRAIVILMHAHVSLNQAMLSIDADEILCVITSPCCNYYGQQEYVFNKRPDYVYDDYAILSESREIRIWCKTTRREDLWNVNDTMMKYYKKPVYDIIQSSDLLITFARPLHEWLLPFNDIWSLIEKDIIITTLISHPVLLFGDDVKHTFATFLHNKGIENVFWITTTSTTDENDRLRLESHDSSVKLNLDDIGHSFKTIIDIGVICNLLQNITTTKEKDRQCIEITKFINQFRCNTDSGQFLFISPQMKKNNYFKSAWNMTWTTTNTTFTTCIDDDNNNNNTCTSSSIHLYKCQSKRSSKTKESKSFQALSDTMNTSFTMEMDRMIHEKTSCHISGTIQRKQALKDVSYLTINVSENNNNEKVIHNVMIHPQYLLPVFNNVYKRFMKRCRIGDIIEVIGHYNNDDQKEKKDIVLIIRAFRFVNSRYDNIQKIQIN